jgi:hypothetical protein
MNNTTDSSSLIKINKRKSSNNLINNDNSLKKFKFDSTQNILKKVITKEIFFFLFKHILLPHN